MSSGSTLKIIDIRLDRIEQKLPTLSTKDELRAAIALLATKEDLRAESERIRTDMRVLHEILREDIRMVAEGVVSLQRTLDDMVRPWLVDHENRIRALESGTQG